jgi:hypothetical protein
VLFGYAYWLRGSWRPAVAWFAVATLWFRCDMVILAGPIVLSMLVCRLMPFTQLIV